jgi:ribose 1,5-bisphosphokinase
MMLGPGRLVLVVGPSGAGKDTLISGAKAFYDGSPAVLFPRRVVTRLATEAEDHDSLSDENFDRAVASGHFSFWWTAHGHKYGIPRSIDDCIGTNRTVICNVSRSIVAEARSRYANVTVVLVTAPPEVLAARLANRSRDSDGSAALRMARSSNFIDFRPDAVIENLDAGLSVRWFVEIIGA